jgi:hypothetical protein
MGKVRWRNPADGSEAMAIAQIRLAQDTIALLFDLICVLCHWIRATGGLLFLRWLRLSGKTSEPDGGISAT